MGQLGDRIGVLTVILETEFVKALSVVLDHGLDAVEAACAKALEAGIASGDVILAVLTRRRQRAVPPSITTPNTLRLTIKPMAIAAATTA